MKFPKITILMPAYKEEEVIGEVLRHMRRAIVDFPKLSHEKLEKLVKWAYHEYYLRPQYIWKKLSKIRSFQDIKELVQTARRLFF